MKKRKIFKLASVSIISSAFLMSNAISCSNDNEKAVVVSPTNLWSRSVDLNFTIDKNANAVFNSNNKYKFEYKKATDSEFIDIASQGKEMKIVANEMHKNKSVVRLDGLEPETKYQFRVFVSTRDHEQKFGEYEKIKVIGENEEGLYEFTTAKLPVAENASVKQSEFNGAKELDVTIKLANPEIFANKKIWVSVQKLKDGQYIYFEDFKEYEFSYNDLVANSSDKANIILKLNDLNSLETYLISKITFGENKENAIDLTHESLDLINRHTTSAYISHIDVVHKNPEADGQEQDLSLSATVTSLEQNGIYILTIRQFNTVSGDFVEKSNNNGNIEYFDYSSEITYSDVKKNVTFDFNGLKIRGNEYKIIKFEKKIDDNKKEELTIRKEDKEQVLKGNN
ncbi:fibronectin type III domain-containing protein [Mesomycoplasma lagogenitalium]|uniref:Fibronectin type-III domain-containing protein n=1 Tax=Mesomycoplasma lagogenitalium TaxID=171286 RepID=A0ABY8LSV9_9BACT|nr:hypothetical protein [Mesomycoplasma lagogenitalium]WGI36344.1 hypothetical protein QEG99_02595 [Mesomycoplasma lagogenitalium]